MMGLEPIRFAAPPPQDGESTNSSTWPETKKVKQLLNFFSDPAGIRTQDPIIKSDVLYQLSYGVIKNQFLIAGANIRPFIYFATPIKDLFYFFFTCFANLLISSYLLV